MAELHVEALLVPRAAPSRRERARGSILIWSGVVLLLLVVAAGIIGPAISAHDPIQQNLTHRMEGPSSGHWLGTDEFGRDVLTRALSAVKIDIGLALGGALLPGILGAILGVAAGYGGRIIDSIVLGVADVLQALPSYVFMLTIAVVIGAGPKAFLVAAVLTAWVPYARIIRSQVLTVRELDYVQAARVSGLSRRRIALRHVLPNAAPQAIVYFASDVAICLLALAGLSYLGFGIPAPTAEWGSMIAGGQPYIQLAPWVTVVPGLMIMVTGVGLSLVSEGLDERRRV